MFICGTVQMQVHSCLSQSLHELHVTLQSITS